MTKILENGQIFSALSSDAYSKKIGRVLKVEVVNQTDISHVFNLSSVSLSVPRTGEASNRPLLEILRASFCHQIDHDFPEIMDTTVSL